MTRPDSLSPPGWLLPFQLCWYVLLSIVLCQDWYQGEPCPGLAVAAATAKVVPEGEEGEGEGGGGESNEGDQGQVRQPGVDESS